MSEGILETSDSAANRTTFPEDFITITNDLNINFYPKIYNKSLDYNNEKELDILKQTSLLISLPIAIAVTSYARMELMKYKMAISSGLLYTSRLGLRSYTPSPGWDSLIADEARYR